MQEFKIAPEGFKQAKRRTILTSLLGIVVVIVFFYIKNIYDNPYGDNSYLFITIPLIIVFVGLGIFRSINRQKAIYNSFKIIITNDSITREKINTPTLSLSHFEVKEIVKAKNGTYIIKGSNKADVIMIPPQMENPTLLEDELNKILPITEKLKDSFIQKYRVLISLAFIALLITVYTATDKVIVTIAGTIVAGLMGYSFYQIQRNKNVDSKTKRGSWIFLLVILSIIWSVIIKVRGNVFL